MIDDGLVVEPAEVVGEGSAEPVAELLGMVMNLSPVLLVYLDAPFPVGDMGGCCAAATAGCLRLPPFMMAYLFESERVVEIIGMCRGPRV